MSLISSQVGFFVGDMSASCSRRERIQELGRVLWPAGQGLVNQGLSHHPQPGSKADRCASEAQGPGYQVNVIMKQVQRQAHRQSLSQDQDWWD